MKNQQLTNIPVISLSYGQERWEPGHEWEEKIFNRKNYIKILVPVELPDYSYGIDIKDSSLSCYFGVNTIAIFSKESSPAKMIDFVEHQEDMINVTKNQCALVQITTTPTGTQTFDLPQELRRQTGRDKARKDCYSALVLGNWFIKAYYDMHQTQAEHVHATFTPFFIN